MKSGCHYSPISLSQTLDNGIYQIEFQFSNNGRDAGIGIVRDSYSINSGEDSYRGTNCQHMATFGGQQYNGGDGCVCYKGNKTEGNKPYQDGQNVRLEYDSGKGTLILFINNEQQPVFVSGIKEKVKFVLGIYNNDRTCTIKSLKKLSAPTSVQMSNGQAVQW
ncbi:MAG: hypothetical protein EZS28_046000 [Streblomastix strix]|uniref:SPRY domain-containing protein n=1 Tax=Streblomastix strix TaxID=222440 RepID=A0A5J4TL51_9EUKA|nr:MAG: hypothetical protein EZS28_046000 [Streblomastix strix]